MRILHILDHSLPLHSGYTFRSRNIVRSQVMRGWELAVITSPKHQESWKGKWEPQETLEDIQYFRTRLSAPTSLKGYYEYRLVSALRRRIQEIASDFRPDVIHAHSPVLNVIPALQTGRQLRIPVVYEIRAFWEDAAVDHGSYGEGSWKYAIVHRLETRSCRKANHVAVICNGLREDLIARGISSDKLSIVPNGINVEEFQERPPDEESASAWGLKGKKVIGFFGSFYRYEGLDLLLEAFALLKQKHSDFSLLLVGGGEMEAFLKERVNTLGLGDRVVLPGRVPHERMPGIYALSDILVYPRHSMRLTELVTPLKPLEAMAMGKAVVASNVGGHRELIKDGETGILFPPADVAALASAMEKLLTDREFRVALARRAQLWVRRERSWEHTTAVYQKIYEKVLAKSDNHSVI